jgi:2-C-methyl-D-erythritol 4-phosphate cytidylyltransferase
MADKLGAIILAGGSGKRFNGKKQFIDFMGKPLWKHSYDTACEIVDKENIIRVSIDVPGGETRTLSVSNGLNALANDTERVLIIEAARPLVTAEQLAQLANDTNKSTTFVSPLVNTVIMRNGDYLNRDEMYEILTPQAFDYRMLLDAINSKCFYDITDDTRIMYEYHGEKPKFIPTGRNLMKVTYQEDMYILQKMYNNLYKKEKR